MKTFKIVGSDLSDGYHTFDELYDHRCLLFINLCFLQPDKVTWRPHYPGWLALFLQTDHGQISYHIPHALLDVIQSKFKREETEWDGHTSSDVIDRLSASVGYSPTREDAQEGSEG